MFALANQYLRQCLPETRTPRRSMITWLIAATVALILVSLIVVAPVLAASGHDSIAILLYAAFSKFCHQIRERSFNVAGHPFAVCARCTGIYFGFAASMLVYPLVRSLNRTDA